MSDPPDFSRRWIPDAKIRDDLLSERSQKSRSRHKLFLGFGFDPAHWEVLRDALMEHVITARIEWARQNEQGHIWRAVGRLTTPDRRNPMIAVYWIVEFDDPRHGSAVPCRTTAKRIRLSTPAPNGAKEAFSPWGSPGRPEMRRKSDARLL